MSVKFQDNFLAGTNVLCTIDFSSFGISLQGKGKSNPNNDGLVFWWKKIYYSRMPFFYVNCQLYVWLPDTNVFNYIQINSIIILF